MIQGGEAVNYAKALLKIPGTVQEIQKRKEDLDFIGNLIKQEPKILHILGCPEIPVERRLEFLEKDFQITMDPHVAKLVALILSRSDEKRLYRISVEYHKLVVNSLEGIDVEVASAEPLSDTVKDQLRNKLEGLFQKQIDFIEKIEPNLLGGFTLLINNRMLDLSIKGKLIQLKKQLLRSEQW